jgi:predicted O-methyltransferase YrrM
LGDNPEIRRVAAKYRAVVSPCRSLRPLNPSSKAVLYAAGHVIPAKKFVCLDADMLVLDDLRPIVAMIDAAPPGSILTCREINWALDLDQAVGSIYGGSPDEISQLTGEESLFERRYSLVVNDGIFAGTRAALRALDNGIRGLNQPARWVDDPVANKPWRNQFIFNLVLAQTDCGVELDPRYNVQLQTQRAEFSRQSAGVIAHVQGYPASILHFNGSGRNQAPEWRGRYRTICRPLTRTDCRSEGYQEFLTALRKWIGHLGTDALAWSFCGTADGCSAHITDASGFPLLGALHYLIRANGCRRVIETGTARGLSAACLASAVAHRTNPVVVTLDIDVRPEREVLWSMLPVAIRECITPRRSEAVEGLRAALSDGETYHAALLDAVHTKDHVLREFELASRLVCEGGLILIHDAVFKDGSVGVALNEIQRQGYGVTRLWTAEDGEREDDALGLAVVENRRWRL